MSARQAKAARAPKSEGQGRLEFFVDARLELDGIMELLAFDLTKGAGGKLHATDFMHPDIAYVREARKYFAPFKDHPAIKFRAQASIRAFDLGQRGQGLMRLSPLPDLKPHSQLSIGFLAHYVGGDAELERWLQSLRDFARDSKFQAFFDAKSGLLAPDLERLKREIEKADYIGKIETYTGLPFVGRYAFVLSPFISCDTGANIVQRGEDGLADIISVVGPTDHPAPGDAVSCTYPRLHARIWHEAAHGVLDNVTELYGEDIAKKQPPQQEATREYQNWMHHVREHMVRSVMLRLVAREISEELSDEELTHEEECGLPHLRAFKKRIAEYEAGRKKYPTFADFYPRLLDALPSAPKGKPSRPLDREGDPYRDWITENAMPFYTESQRRRALWYLDLMLSRSRQPGLLLKRACINQLLGRAEEALADAEGVLALRPGDPGALLIKKGGAAARPSDGGPGSRPDPSQTRPVEKAPPGRENPHVRPPEVQKLNDDGVKAYLKGDHGAALKKFEAALRAAPNDPQTLVNVAVVFSETAEPGRALEAYEKAIETCLAVPSPESRATAASAMSSRASLHERAKRAKEARADLERALQLAPPEWDKRPAIEKRLKALG
jgi:tetratricopeptide (TPR) repeat protein